MAIEQPKQLPQFQPYATASAFLTDTEIDGLLAEHASLVTEGKLALGDANSQIRRSQVVMLGNEPKYAWLYERILGAARECNRLFFCVDILGIEANLQLGRYDSSDRGFYGWHTDFAGIRPNRKLSISIQLSQADDYEGGDLEVLYGMEPQKLDRTRGAFIVFPSFMLHRVTPVTRGTRWSLVAWVVGERWR
jgi:PKHD-type hydroxylase